MGEPLASGGKSLGAENSSLRQDRITNEPGAVQERQRAAGAAAAYPSVTSPLCAANAARTSCFSCSGTLTKSRVRPSSVATSSNSAGEIFELAMSLFQAENGAPAARKP